MRIKRWHYAALLARNIDTIAVCELRRGFALQCFHLNCIYTLAGGEISIRDMYICAVHKFVPTDLLSSTGPLSVQ